MSTDLIILCARFVHEENGTPLAEPNLRVRFYDADAVADDFLGESALDATGTARAVISPERFRSGLKGPVGEAFGELEPDIFCEVLEDGRVIFRSEVLWDTEPTPREPVPGIHRTIDIGTIRFIRGGGLGDEDPMPIPFPFGTPV